jgi:putative ABC transport system permease protein
MWLEWLQEAGSRVANIFRRSQLESELDEELRFHLEMQIEQYVQAGMSENEARRLTLVEFGGLDKTLEDCRDALGLRLMHDFIQDVRYAVRVLVRSPGFTTVAVLTLALGIGANTAVFSVVNALLLQPLPFENPDRIVMLWEDNPDLGVENEQVAWADLLAWQKSSTSFESMGFVVNRMAESRNFLMKSGDDVSRIRARHVSSSLFDVLGVPPLIGQTLSLDDDEPGGLHRVVLSHRIWTQVFGANPEIIGQTIDLGKAEPFEVIGVMPERFRFPQAADAWLSVAGLYNERMMKGMMASHGHHPLWVTGRLKAGVTPAEAEAELDILQRQIHSAPENQSNQRLSSGVTVTPLLDQVNGSGTRPALLLLLGAVGFVLLIACANVANLLLARAISRRREMAIRAALGAGRFRVIRQLLTESLLLSLLGAAAATVLAVWGIDLLELIRLDSTYLGVKEFRFDRIGDVQIDRGVLGFTIAVSVVTGVLFGLIPAIQASRLDINNTLKEDGRSGTPAKAARLFRNALLISEVSLALVLLAGAGLAIRSFSTMLAIDPGIDPQSVLQAELDLDMAKQVYGMKIEEAFDEVVYRLSALPSVAAVSGIGEIPIVKSGWNDTFRIVGPEHEGLENSALPYADLRLMSPGVFESLGIPLLSGRDFNKTDTTENPSVAIINQALAEKYFRGQDPIGRRIQFRGWANKESEIVGVAGNVRNYSSDGEDQHELYYPFAQQFMGGSEVGPVILIRVHGNTDDMVPAIRAAVDGPDPRQQVLIRFRNVQSMLDNSASQERFQTILLGVFSGIALLLAVVGVYGVMSYSTSQRIQEVGIRLALGAQPHQILRTIVGEGVILSSVGIFIGVGISIGLGRLLSTLFFGVETVDAVTLGAVAVVLLIVSATASLIPAWRAMRVDPLTALRHE